MARFLFPLVSVALASEDAALADFDDGLSLLQLSSRRVDDTLEVEVTTTVEPPAQIGTDKRCTGRDVVRGKFDSVEACIAEFVPRGDVTTLAFYLETCRNPQHRGLCLGWGGECTQSQVHRSVNTALYDLFPPPVVEDAVDAPLKNDEASATADPHLVTVSGDHVDLCCKGGKCEACPSLLEVDAPVLIATDKRCVGKDIVRGKFDNAKACFAEFVPRGDVTTVAFYKKTCKNPKHRGICLGWGGECTQSGIHRTVHTALYDLSPPVIEVDPPATDDEASATADPHLVTASGDKLDLCCEGGKCEPCSN